MDGLCPAGWLKEQSITKHRFQSVRTCPYSWATGRNISKCEARLEALLRGPTFEPFQIFVTSNLLTKSLKLRCQSVWDWCHNPCFLSTSLCNSHYKNIDELISLKRKIVTPGALQMALLLIFIFKNYVSYQGTGCFLRACNRHSVCIIKTRFISNVLSNAGRLTRFLRERNWIGLT